MDVIVDPAWRKRGIGRGMVKFLLEHPDLKLVYQWMLRTRDAQGVYAPLGFKTIVDPGQWMVIQTNRPVRDPFPGL
jgi:GNAT superfamily N-acetyltransferase